MMDWTTAPTNSESDTSTRRRGNTNRRTSSSPISPTADSDRMIAGPRIAKGASSMVRIVGVGKPSANAVGGHLQAVAPIGVDFVDQGLAAQLEHLVGGGRREDVHEPRDDPGPP